jgi:hypothetical protein
LHINTIAEIIKPAKAVFYFFIFSFCNNPLLNLKNRIFQRTYFDFIKKNLNRNKKKSLLRIKNVYNKNTLLGRKALEDPPPFESFFFLNFIFIFISPQQYHGLISPIGYLPLFYLKY